MSDQYIVPDCRDTRTDELDDAVVRVSDLPKLFHVSRSTIDDWISKDNLTTFPHPTWDGKGRTILAVRWGSIPIGKHPTRWTRRTNRKST